MKEIALNRIQFKIAVLILACNAYSSANSDNKNSDLTVYKEQKQRMENDQLIISLGTLPKSLDPAKMIFQQHVLVAQSLYQTLVHIDETGRLVADLATKWEISDHSKTYRFHIGDSTFHNGKKVTAKDVAYSLGRHFLRTSPSAASGYLKGIIVGTKEVESASKISGIKVISDNILEISLDKAYPSLLFILTMPSWGVISKDAFELNSGLVGSGPMKLLKQTSDMILLERNASYKGTRSSTQSIQLIQSSSNQAAFDLAASKKIDAAMLLISSEDEKSNLPEGYKFTVTNTIAYNHLFPNTAEAPLNNTQYRIDLKNLITSFAKDSSIMTSNQKFEPFYLPKGVMPPSYYKRDIQDLTPIEFKKRWKVYEGNRPLRVLLEETWVSKAFSRGLHDLLQTAGVVHNIASFKAVDLVKHLKAKDYDLISACYVGNFPDPDGFIDPITGNSGLTFGSFERSKFIEEIENARFVEDQGKRLSLYENALKKIEEDGLIFPLYRQKLSLIHNKKMRIPETNFRYESELWNMIWDK